MSNWTLVYSAATSHEAELMRAMLEEHEITAVVMDKGSSSVYPQLNDSGVYVDAEHVVRALHLIKAESRS